MWNLFLEVAFYFGITTYIIVSHNDVQLFLLCATDGFDIVVPIREVSSFQKALCTGVGPDDVSLLERCPHFRRRYVQASMELDLKMCPY